MSAMQEIAEAFDSKILEDAPEVKGLGGRLPYLYGLRFQYGPGATLATVIAREKRRLGAEGGR